MMKNLKTLMLGLVIGAIVGFPLGMNYGRGDSLLSNPFRDRSSLQEKAKSKVKDIADKARAKLHEVSTPQ
jgi:hypothetical protein